MKQGDIIFVKSAFRIGSNPQVYFKTEERAPRGQHFIAVAIGCLRKQTDALTHEQLKMLIAESGLVTFDDVIECLGQDAFPKLEAHLKQRYEKAAEPAAAVTS